MKSLLRLICTLGAVAVGAPAVAATYEGNVGSNGAKARLEFANGLVSGVLCVEKPGLNMRYDIYTIGGQNPEGRMTGRLLLDGNAVASFSAVKRATSDEITWEGTASIERTSKPLRLTRHLPSDGDEPVPKTGFQFGPKDKDEQTYIPDALTVTAPTSKLDQVISLLNSMPAITNVEMAAASTIQPLYGIFLDDCQRKLYDSVTLGLKVDAFLLWPTYNKLVSSKLFTGVRTEPVPLGPGSMEIPVKKALIGSGKGSEKDISDFLDMLVERYFRQMRNSENACRKHSAGSIFAALQALPLGSSDNVEIDRLETNKYYFRRFSILGPSKGLIFGLPNHWERYVIEAKLYPSFSKTGQASDEYSVEMTMTTGEMAPFQEAAKPPEERFKPIPERQLEKFLAKYTACISQYLTGACPPDAENLDDVTRRICGKDK